MLALCPDVTVPYLALCPDVTFFLLALCPDVTVPYVDFVSRCDLLSLGIVS